jgi:two-component system osmolarity sensor histidine kinase EnvZ
LGGYWLAVQRSSAASRQLWVYASPGTALPWLWPAIRLGSLLLGGSSGVALFLQWQLQRPIQQLLKQLPAIPSGELELVPEAGMGAMRELSIRINRVLEQLNQQHESRRRFLQGLAHDLGSPLTRLSMRVERLEDHPADPTAWDEALPQLRVEIDRLISLTHLLQEAAGEQTEPFRPRLSALDELCERVVASYPQQPIELAVPRLLVRLDQALIERALQNLIDNAIRYGRAPIRLAAQQQRASVVLMVEDSGPGLSSANLLGMPRIPPANDRQQRNRSGVGLSIVERCCQLHGGRLALNRSGLGGLQAELHLPQS